MKDVAQIPEEKQVYLDESGVDPCLIRERGRAPRGTKVEDVKRGRKFQRTNVIAAKIGDRLGRVHVIRRNNSLMIAR